MKTVYYLVLIAVFLASCSTAPPESSINTAIAKTLEAQPTSTLIPTNTPYPTYTPFPTTTPTHVSTFTATPALTTCNAVYLYVIDIVPASGKGVLVTVDCSESDPNIIKDIMVVLPSGTSSTMVDEALQYVHQVAVKGGWDVNDVDVIFQLETSDCAKTLVTSREVSGFCIAVGQESSVIALLETP